MIRGGLKSTKDYQDLKTIIHATIPPVGVAYYVSINGDEKPGEFIPAPSESSMRTQ